MQLSEQLRALRTDPGSQRHAQNLLNAKLLEWCDRYAGHALEAELAGFAAGGNLEDFPILSACFDPGDGLAMEMVSALVELVANGLEREPLGQVPMRHFTNGTISTLLIGRKGPVSLALVAVDGVALSRRPNPESASFAPNHGWERVLTGSAEGEFIDIVPLPGNRAQISREPLALAPGKVIARDYTRRAIRLDRIDGTLVSLRLQRRRDNGPLTREYRLSDGALVHQAAGNPRDSRFELAAALLGRMGRTDAVPMLAAMVREDRPATLRWQMLRECLSLDSAAGFEALTAIATSPDDPLAAPAGALRAQLLEQYPQLAEIAPCPA